jgi:alpha-D-ribose 1-methylphosphonate 5-triphosphate synthase subunit PhnI
MYVATRGGESAIAAAHEQLRRRSEPRRGSSRLNSDMLVDQMSFLITRVMCEGSVYDPDLAADALLQAQGDVVEAIFLVRAFRATVPRLGRTCPLEVERMMLSRRISAVFKDIPGGQVLGATFDYSHRLLRRDHRRSEARVDPEDESDSLSVTEVASFRPRALAALDSEGLLELVRRPDPEDDGVAVDITVAPISYPVVRPAWLQALARADEGFVLALGYSTQRGFGSTHPFAGEVRVGWVELRIVVDVLGEVVIGEIELTEVEMVNQFLGNEEQPPAFTRGYGLGFGHCERRAMSMALVDRALRAEELGEVSTGSKAPAQDAEFVLAHCDPLEATGFVSHLKLPHYVDFQSELVLLRSLRADRSRV